MKRSLLLTAIALFAAGCNTAPPVFSFDDTEVYKAERDLVWAGIVDYFSTRDVTIATIDKESGAFVGSFSAKAPTGGNEFLSGYAACPGVFLSAPREDETSINVFVIATNDGAKVRVKTVHKRMYYSEFAEIHETWECNSTGFLERTLLNHVKGYLVSDREYAFLSTSLAA